MPVVILKPPQKRERDCKKRCRRGSEQHGQGVTDSQTQPARRAGRHDKAKQDKSGWVSHGLAPPTTKQDGTARTFPTTAMSIGSSNLNSSATNVFQTTLPAAAQNHHYGLRDCQAKSKENYRAKTQKEDQNQIRTRPRCQDVSKRALTKGARRLVGET